MINETTIPNSQSSIDQVEQKNNKNVADDMMVADLVCETGCYHIEKQEVNEDFADYNEKFFGVADGVGGGAFGNIAAQTMINNCIEQNKWKNAEDIHEILVSAQKAVTSAILNLTQNKGGCAFAGIWFDRTLDTVYYTWIGDVRIYHIYADTRPERHQESLLIKRLTTDQTYTNLGEKSPTGNQDSLARLVGFDSMGQPEINSLFLNRNEYLLILSDGVHSYLSHQQLQAYCQLLLQPNAELKTFCQTLVEAAKHNLSHDDCTALILTKLACSALAPTDSSIPSSNHLSTTSNSYLNSNARHIKPTSKKATLDSTFSSILANDILDHMTNNRNFYAKNQHTEGFYFKIILMAILFWLFGISIGRLHSISSFINNYLSY